MIRQIDPDSRIEIELVAARMRQTLIGVLGEETGTNMYSIDWLIQRVRFHLDPAQSVGQVFVAEDTDGHVAGHTIVRIELEEIGRPVGLFSTTFVEPESRNRGIATELLDRGEQWMIEQGLEEAVTYTAEWNVALKRLFVGRGYDFAFVGGGFLRLSKPLAVAARAGQTEPSRVPEERDEPLA